MQGEDVGINREDDRTTAIRGTRHVDPRLFQILALGSLLGVGAWLRDFAIRPEQSALAFAAAIVTQRLIDRHRGRMPTSLRSATITALSLSLLLRADNLWAHPLAAVVAIGAK